MGSAVIGGAIGLAVAGVIWFGGHEIHRLATPDPRPKTAGSGHRPARVS